jgi:hypothetical protein
MCGIAEAGLALSALGTAGSVLGAMQQGQAAQAQADYQAAVYEREANISEMKARDAEYRGRMERQDIALQAAKMVGAGRAGWGASGVQLGSGSPLDWEVDLDERARADDRMSHYNTEQEKWGYRNNAIGMREQAGLSRLSGANSATAGRINAMGSLLSGAGSVASGYYKLKG